MSADITPTVLNAFERMGRGFAIRYANTFNDAPSYVAIHEQFVKDVRDIQRIGFRMLADLENKAWSAYYNGANGPIASFK
jgi:hypothetical protein